MYRHEYRNSNEKRVIIGINLIATNEDCKWAVLFFNGNGMMGISTGTYKTMLENGENALLVPFGSVYILLKVEIRGNVISLNIKSRNGETIPVDFMGMLVFVAIEHVKRKAYLRDNFLSPYAEYYNAIRKKLPDKYIIKINGFSVALDNNIILKYVRKIINFTDSHASSSFRNCFACPLKNICGPTQNRNTFIANLRSAAHFENLYLALKQVGLPALLIFLTLIFLYGHNHKDPFSALGDTLKYLNEFGDGAVEITFEDIKLDGHFLCLRDGTLFRNYTELIESCPDVKIYSHDGEISLSYRMRYLAMMGLIDEPICEKLDTFLREYSEKNRYIFYMGMMEHSLVNIEHFKNRECLLKTFLGFITHILSSDVYKEGYVAIDLQELVVCITKKGIEKISELCGGGAL